MTMTTPTEEKVNSKPEGIDEEAFDSARSISASSLIDKYHRDLYVKVQKDYMVNKRPIFLWYTLIFSLLNLGLIFPILLFAFSDNETACKVLTFAYFFNLAWLIVAMAIQVSRNEMNYAQVKDILNKDPQWDIKDVSLLPQERLFLQAYLTQSSRSILLNWETALRIRYYSELIGITDIVDHPNKALIQQL